MHTGTVNRPDQFNLNGGLTRALPTKQDFRQVATKYSQ